MMLSFFKAKFNRGRKMKTPILEATAKEIMEAKPATEPPTKPGTTRRGFGRFFAAAHISAGG